MDYHGHDTRVLSYCEVLQATSLPYNEAVLKAPSLFDHGDLERK